MVRQDGGAMMYGARVQTFGRRLGCAVRQPQPGPRVRLPGKPRPSAQQIAAIHAVMRLFIEDDLANGTTADAMRPCDRCRLERPAAGFIRYGDRQVCNGCATAYEIDRITGE